MRAPRAQICVLTPQTRASARAVTKLKANRTDLRIKKLFSGASLQELWWADPASDARVPDIAFSTIPGTVFTSKDTKIAEHGGFDTEERHVALMVSLAGVPRRSVPDRVYTTQARRTLCCCDLRRQALYRAHCAHAWRMHPHANGAPV
jgi:hypothetical protein